MKVSTIKTAIQKPIKKVLPYVLGAMTIMSCQTDSQKLKDYCGATDKSQKEYVTLKTRFKENSNNKKIVANQALLDSLVYRDLFNQTHLANDSASVAEFNKIARTYKAENINFYNELLNTGITVDDFERVRKKRHEGLNDLQYKADKYLFGNFFTKKGLMGDEKFAKKFETLSLFLSPATAYRMDDVNYKLREIDYLK